MNSNYELALLFLTHLLIDADGVQHEKEMEALKKIKEHETISDESIAEFEQKRRDFSEKDTYATSLRLLNDCTTEQKLRIFSILHRLSEVDGNVHGKEIRLLLYSLHDIGISYADVLAYKENLPAI